MIYSKIYLHLADTWLGYDGSTLTEHKDWPLCEGPVLALDDFGTAPSGIQVLDGKTEHASAIIEHKVREQGLADGESHVVLHQRLRVTGGQQVLFTAVPVLRWQQLQSWIERQEDHCLVVPLLSLIAGKLEEGCGVIACHGRQLSVLVHHANRLIYLSGMAYSDNPDDLRAALVSLAGQVGEQLRGFKLDAMVWLSLYLSNAAAEEDLAQTFSDVSGIPLQLAPSRTVQRPDKPDVRVGVDHLLEHFHGQQAINALPGRLFALAEMRLPWAIGACMLVAVCMFAYGIYATVQTGALEGRAAAFAQRAQAQTARATALMDSLKAPAGYEPVSSFAKRLDRLAASLNPYSALADIRNAADQNARILRVRYEHNERKKISAILVDGVLRDSANVAQGISVIVTRLRQEGYEPTAMQPSEANPSPAFFSYRLVRREQ